MVGIDVSRSRELQAVILAMRRADRKVAGSIRKYTKSEMAPVWQQLLVQNSHTVLQQKVLAAKATVAVSDTQVTVKSSTTGKLTDGTPVTQLAGGVEFGGSKNFRRSYRSFSKKNTPYDIENRRTRIQLGPIKESGKVVYPTFQKYLPRLASLWVQTIVKGLADASKGK